MEEVVPYKSRFPLPEGAERFTAYVDGKAALMLEFFEDHYHVYGARAGSVSDVLATTLGLYESFGAPLNEARFSYVAVTRGGEEIAEEVPLVFGRLERFLYRIPDVQHLAMSSNLASLWADIPPVKNSRSGMACRFRTTGKKSKFLRAFTPVKISDEDLGNIAVFLLEKTRGRYETYHV